MSKSNINNNLNTKSVSMGQFGLQKVYIKSFSDNRVELSNGTVYTCDLNKDEIFDYDILKKIIEES